MDDLDVRSVQSAITTIVQFPLTIHTAATSAQGIPLGPWSVGGSCHYGLSDMYTKSWSSTVDFSDVRSELQSTLTAAEQHAASFLTSFASVHSWLGTDLPATSAAFSAAATVESQALAEIQQSGTVTPATQAALAEKLKNTLSLLQQGSRDLTQGSQDIARYSEEQDAYTAQVGTAVRTVSSTVQNALNRLQADVSANPCGQSEAQRQFASHRDQFVSATASFQALFSALKQQTEAASNAVALLIGTVQTAQNKYQPILTQIQSAPGATVNAALQNLHLSIAGGLWSDLATFAANQLSTAQTQFAAELQRPNGAVLSGTVDLTAQIQVATARVFGNTR